MLSAMSARFLGSSWLGSEWFCSSRAPTLLISCWSGRKVASTNLLCAPHSAPLETTLRCNCSLKVPSSACSDALLVSDWPLLRYVFSSPLHRPDCRASPTLAPIRAFLYSLSASRDRKSVV